MSCNCPAIRPVLKRPRVLDFCTGSGCVAAAIAHHLKNAVVIAADLSEAAVAGVAKANVLQLGLDGRVTVVQGDLFEALAHVPDPAPFNLIVANPPYIPTGQIEQLDRNVRDFEPRTALDGGIDGLVIHRRILVEAPERLESGGRIYLEIQFDQGALVKELMMAREELEDVRMIKDYGGNERLVTARKK